MVLNRCFAIAIVALLLGAQASQAQVEQATVGPAEFPPASFQGRQYVDSKGCVFIRAGVEGNVTWVPRISRNRVQLCGYVPTLAKAPSPPAPRVTSEPNVKPSPGETAKAKIAPAPAERKASATVTAPAPANGSLSAQTNPGKPLKQARPAVASAPEIRKVTPLPAPGTGNQTRIVVRVTAPSRQPVPGSPATPGSVPPGTRVAPAHVYANQLASMKGISIPAGYKPAWEDNRLNLKRAHQTFEGMAQMQTLWTDTVPRKLKPQKIVPNTTATISSRSSPSAAVEPASQRFVEIGHFTSPEKAHRAAQDILRAGFPARKGSVKRNDRTYTLLLAGPFTTKAELDAGLERIRAIGFAQARPRR